MSAPKNVLSAQTYALCVPLAERTTTALLEACEAAVRYRPDLLEWRLDAFERIDDDRAVIRAGRALRRLAGDIPIILTIRHGLEGGVKPLPDERKFRLLQLLSRRRLIRYADLELRYGRVCLLRWQERLHRRGVELIVSYHDFDHAPDAKQLEALLRSEAACGADVCKVYITPERSNELAALGNTIRVFRSISGKPVIFGVGGACSPLVRVLGDAFGSNLTFVTAGASGSNPTQLPIEDVRALRYLILREGGPS